MATTAKINLLSRVASLDVAPTFTNYSKVIIHINDDTIVEVGDDTGRTLEFDDPFGSQELAEQMLEKLRGYQYQPMYASSALLDPAAEIGDGVSAKGIYSGLYKRTRTFNQLMPADIAAPHDEEINHEYKYVPPQERRFNRQIDGVKATLLIQAGLIEAKVSKESPEGQTSFSWAMNDTSHTWYANGREVMKVNASGLEIKGKVTATEGYIGNGSNGFTIKASAIYNGVTSMSDTSHNGVYVGTDGITIGKGKFKVDSSGNVTASAITATGLKLKGTLTFYNSDGTSAGTLTAANLRQGSLDGYNWSRTASVSYGGDMVTPASYCSSSAGTWNTAQSSPGVIANIYAKSFHGSETSYFNVVSAYYFQHYYTGQKFAPGTITVDGTSYTVLMAQ